MPVKTRRVRQTIRRCLNELVTYHERAETSQYDTLTCFAESTLFYKCDVLSLSSLESGDGMAPQTHCPSKY
eukprot:6205966-Pleurochrysis_carterae.AAC.1